MRKLLLSLSRIATAVVVATFAALPAFASEGGDMRMEPAPTEGS